MVYPYYKIYILIKNILRQTIKVFLIAQVIFLFNSVPAIARNLDPYSFDQVRDLLPVLQEDFMPPVIAFRKPRPLPNSAAETPTMVSDQEGNKYIYVDGELRVKFDSEGNQVYYAKKMPRHERNYEGSLVKLYEYDGAQAKVKNEFGELLGYEEFGLGGLLLRTYDEDYNLTKSYTYENRTLDWILDELYGSKTKYGIEGPEYDMDFEGNITAYYKNDRRRIQKRIEKSVNGDGEVVDGDITSYDETGKFPVYKVDFEGNVVLTYQYAEYNRLKSTVDQYGDVTEYKTGRQMVLKHKEGGVFKVWNWQGTKLISTEDKVTHGILGLSGGEVTYYKNEKPVYTRFEDGKVSDIVKRWVYDEGKLLARWEAGRDGVESNKIVLYDHGREVISFVWVGNYPTEEELYSWAKAKTIISIDGRARGVWDSKDKELMALNEKGEVIDVVAKEKQPTKEDLILLIFNLNNQLQPKV